MQSVNFICPTCKKLYKIKPSDTRIGLPNMCKPCVKANKEIISNSGEGDIPVEPSVVNQSQDYEEVDV